MGSRCPDFRDIQNMVDSRIGVGDIADDQILPLAGHSPAVSKQNQGYDRTGGIDDGQAEGLAADHAAAAQKARQHEKQGSADTFFEHGDTVSFQALTSFE